MFLDLSSAFNTIQPHIFARKLLDMNVPSSYVSWMFGYLTSRCQYVSLERIRSSSVHTPTGAPQNTVLAPFMYTLYTSDYRSSDNVYPLVKSANDSVIVGMVNNDDDSGYLIILQLNVTKTK